MFNDKVLLKLKRYIKPSLIVSIIIFILNIILLFIFSIHDVDKIDKNTCDEENVKLYNNLVGDEYKVAKSNEIGPKVYKSYTDKKLVNIGGKECKYWDSDNLVCVNGSYSVNGICNIDGGVKKIGIVFTLSIIFLILSIVLAIINKKL
tara:strand:- start:1791 stop:2234 length:444 start_codon:yes stop_codon:yes gene_type:complete